MKNIEAVPIWDNGQNKNATILNAKAVNVTLGISAIFFYTLLNEQEQLSQGNLTMSGDAYEQWSNDDEYAWDWVATQLNLTITGDYVPPVVEPIVEVTAQADAESEPIDEVDNNLE